MPAFGHPTERRHKAGTTHLHHGAHEGGGRLHGPGVTRDGHLEE